MGAGFGSSPRGPKVRASSSSFRRSVELSETASILIVEDDENLRIGLQDNLEAEGYLVAVAAGAAEAEAHLRDAGFDLVVLDIMLPNGDGYTVRKSLRERGSDAMVLMLTARSLEEDLLRGFDVGADDYLSKPYRLAELLARVRALLRRRGSVPATATSGVLSFDGYRLDPQSRSLHGRAGGRARAPDAYSSQKEGEAGGALERAPLRAGPHLRGAGS